MTKTKAWALGVIFFAAACQNSVPKDSEQDPSKGQPTRKNNFFPVADYLRSEIALVDSMPIGFARYRVRMGKSDTSFVATAVFDSLAKEFLPPEFSDSVFEKDFQESSFIDQSTQSVTFTYSTKEDKPGLRRVDVLAKQDPAFDKIKSIYMEKTEIHQDTIIQKKLIWKSKQSIQIITITQPANRPLTTEQIKLVWDNVD